MAEIINLRQARKARACAEAAARADANRVAFGRTRQEKTSASAESIRQARLLDGAKLDDEDG